MFQKKTPVQAPIKRAGAKTPPINPNLMQIVVSNNLNIKNIRALYIVMLTEIKLTIVDVPKPVTSGSITVNKPQIKAAIAGWITPGIQDILKKKFL